MNRRMDSLSLTNSQENRPNFGSSLMSTSDLGLNDENQSSKVFSNINMSDKWQNDSYRARFKAGIQIAFYELENELGNGKFSQVKLGRHMLTGNLVAVKIIKKSRANEHRQYIFQRELRILEMPFHPNIIRLYEYINTLDQIFVITELAHGLNVQKLIVQNGSLSEANTLQIFGQLVAAVEHLHSMSIAHRDIKSDNLIYDPATGIVKLIDFGFACHVTNETKSKTFCGSLPFAAPELLLSKPYEAKPVDMWAMGVLLYFMRCGMLPFGGTTLYELKKNIRQGEFSIYKVFSDNMLKVLGGLMQLEVSRRMTIKKVMKSSLLIGIKFQPASIQISSNCEDTDDRTQHLVQETRKFIINDLSVDPKKLDEALCAGLHQPITGLYRLKFVELCKKYYEPQMASQSEQVILETKLMKLKEKQKKKAQSKTTTQICTII